MGPRLLGATLIAAFSLPAQPKIAGCAVFAADSIWNTPIDRAPLDANSQAYVESAGRDKPLVTDFGSGLYQGGPIGIPFVVVAGSQPRLKAAFQYADESDAGPYAVPLDAPIEGGSKSTGDRHAIALDKDNCVLYELYSAFPQPDGTWRAGSGAIFDLKSHKLRPETWTSADAAGLPIVPGLVRYEEILEGEIRHAIRFTVARSRRAYVWPGRHFASSRTEQQYPPMGQRFRLKADYDISGFHPENQILLKALKKYGIILADNGSDWFLSGAPDDRWNNDRLRELRRLHGGDFEAVDVSAWRIEKDSGQSLQQLQHAATFQPGPVAANQIVSIFPPAPITTASFDDVQAAILYNSPTQVNAVVPGVLGPRARVELRDGQSTVWAAQVPVVEANPGIFEAVNEDDRINSESTPALKGSRIAVYGTGGQSGMSTAVTIAGQSVESGIEFIGPLQRLFVRIPPGAPSGRQTLVWSVGRYQSQPDFGVWVR